MQPLFNATIKGKLGLYNEIDCLATTVNTGENCICAKRKDRFCRSSASGY